MGGRNKHKKTYNNNNNHNKSSQNFAPKLTEDELCDLVTEATQIHILLNSRHEKLKESKDFVYLLSTKWLREWKDYVGYDEMFTDQKEGAGGKKTGKKRPGPPNSDLTRTSGLYLEVPQELEQYQYLNTIIKQKMEAGDDFISIPEGLWQQFNSIYGPGTAIKRPFRLTKSKTVYTDSLLFHCDLILLNHTEQNYATKLQSCKQMTKANIEKLVPSYKVQFSGIWELEQLFEYLERLALVKFQNQKVTLWLHENFMGTYGIQEQIVKSAKAKDYKINAIKLDKQQNKYQDLDLQDFLKENYTFILEIGDSKLVPADLPEQIFGYCQQCVQKKKLEYQCECGHKFYCSHSCQTDDQVFHFKSCKLAFHSEDDQQYEKKKVKGASDVTRCGLKNLGNTCYMNSSLQVFLGLDFIVDFMSNNEYKDCISEKETYGEMFMDKVSKLCKQMGEETEMGSFAPWDIKGQINYFLVPFKGYKQHDAIDFFMGFLNTINDCLKKPEQQAYHAIIRNNILGSFDSLVICPDCNNQVKNFECFTQLTLPIKSKGKKQLYNYVLFDGVMNLRYGKAEVRGTWDEVRSELGVDGECLIYIGGESQAGLMEIDFDEGGAEHTLKKLKKQLLVYPLERCRSEGQFAIPANFITMKSMSGVNLKANSGYPFPIIVDNSMSIGHVFIAVIRKFRLFDNEEILGEMEHRYQDLKNKQREREKEKEMMKQQDSTTTTTTQVQAPKVQKPDPVPVQQPPKQKKGKNKKQEQKQPQPQPQPQQPKHEDPIQQQFHQLNQQLYTILETANTKIYVQDTKKIKNVCFFCKRKCDGCALEPDFRVSVEDSLAFKAGEMRMYIHVTPKLEQVKVREDLASTGDATLKDCLTLFGQPQKLDEQNAWWCPECQDMRLALKQLHISTFPKYLIIQLSRFKNGANGKIKNNQPIFYNEYQQFGGNCYRLLSVIVHEGSIQGGHYWAICRRGNAYYIFNDDKVSKTDKICNKNAYILCYQRWEQGQHGGKDAKKMEMEKQ